MSLTLYTLYLYIICCFQIDIDFSFGIGQQIEAVDWKKNNNIVLLTLIILYHSYSKQSMAITVDGFVYC